VLSLRWQDVDWEAGKIVVRSPKTEHHPGKDCRTIPIFGRLRPFLEEAWELAPEGAEHVVGDGYLAAANTPGGWRNCNLRSQMERLVKRAGLTPWPRLFHAMRASCETDLAQVFPIHVVTAWLGNTPKIAMKHYLTVTENDYQSATQGGAKCGALGAQKAAQPPIAGIRPGSQETTQPLSIPRGCANFGEPKRTLAGVISGEDRTRTDSHNPLQDNELGNLRQVSAAAGAATDGDCAPIDPGLALIVNIWPALPESVRKNVLTIIRTAAQHHASGGDA
jgi:hypothetical protein